MQALQEEQRKAGIEKWQQNEDMASAVDMAEVMDRFWFVHRFGRSG